mgnify:CR=1 FL=1
MKNSIIAICSLSLFLLSCGDPAETKSALKSKDAKSHDITLEEADIFDGLKIVQFLNNKTKFTKESNELFLNGINSYKNNEDLDSAIFYFKKSIVKEPTARAYCELGNVYKQKKNHKEALQAYKLAEQLDYAPFSNLLYNIATVYALQDKVEEAGNYLEFAMQAGFNNMDKIEKDPELALLREHHEFKSILKRGLRGMSDPDKLFWLQFKKQFPKLNMPTTLKWDLAAEEVEALQWISYDFEKYIPEMRDEKFSREVSKGFYYYAQVMENDQFVGVIYVEKDEFMGEFAPLTYRLATFTPSGKLIDKRDVSGKNETFDEVRLATIKANGAIDVELLRLEHEKDVDEVGYWDNPVDKITTIGKENYQVKSNGKIELISESRKSSANELVAN